jgi:hypothetical protein
MILPHYRRMPAAAAVTAACFVYCCRLFLALTACLHRHLQLPLRSVFVPLLCLPVRSAFTAGTCVTVSAFCVLRLPFVLPSFLPGILAFTLPRVALPPDWMLFCYVHRSALPVRVPCGVAGDSAIPTRYTWYTWCLSLLCLPLPLLLPLFDRSTCVA